jgi:hypothetical protein
MLNSATGGTAMPKRTLILASLLLVSLSANAQTAAPPAVDRPNNNAVNSPNVNNSTKPVSGANSFTEGQAKSRIESAGFSAVSDLKKDDAGVWRGKASKGGKQVSVSLDFQGNVIGQ